jgi:hypothetical protein
VIPEYLERLARELDFDPPLSRRVCREVEDHLWEAASADPALDGSEAERRAVSGFGDPRAIAAQFAVLSFTQRARRLGVAAVLLIAAAFIVMRARFSWYGLMQWSASHQTGSLAAVVLSIDRYAFWLSFLAGIGCWMYIDSRRVPGGFTREYRGRIRRFALLSMVATAALIVSVVSDGVLTAIRLAGAEWSFELLLPVFSMTIEIACAGLLVSYLRGLSVPILAASRGR